MSSINTGLTDIDKESLLKFFLTHCTVMYKEDVDENSLFPYKVNFRNDTNVHKDDGTLISKAMLNLQNSALRF